MSKKKTTAEELKELQGQVQKERNSPTIESSFGELIDKIKPPPPMPRNAVVQGKPTIGRV